MKEVQIDDIQKTILQLRDIKKLGEHIESLETMHMEELDLDYLADTLDDAFRKNIEITQYFLNKSTNPKLIEKYKQSIDEMNKIRNDIKNLL